jgi:anti-anti-sigma factor
MSNIEVSTNKKGEVSIIYIKGDVTTLTGGTLEDAYQKVSTEGTKKIILCFDRESYINSGGIAVLIGTAAESRNKGQKIRITGLSEHFQKIFNMVGLTRYTELFPSEEAALQDF